MTSESTDPGPPGTEAMLSVLIGASDYPRKPDWSNPVLGASAQALRDYVLSPAGLALAPTQLLDLFDDDASPDGQLHRIADFLTAARGARDLLVYYIGHGGFQSDEYYLGIRNTKRDREFITTIESKKLAKVIRDEFRRKRVYVILDSCFSAAAASDWQGNEIAVAVRKMSQRLPAYGTVLLAAASKYDVTHAPRTERYTVFTGAVLSALTRGIDRAQPKLSISDLYEEVCDIMRHREIDYEGRPEIYVPNQRDGDVSRLPLFPNTAYSYTEAYRAAVLDVEAAEAAATRARDDATARAHAADTARTQLKAAELEATKALDEAVQAENEVVERERDVEQARDRLKSAQTRLAARAHLAAAGSGISSSSKDGSAPDPSRRRSASVIAAIALAGAAFIACAMYVITRDRGPAADEPRLDHEPAGPADEALTRLDPDRDPVVTDPPTRPPEPQAPVAPDPKPMGPRAQDPQPTDQKVPDPIAERAEGEPATLAGQRGRGPTAPPENTRGERRPPKRIATKISDDVDADVGDDNKVGHVEENPHKVAEQLERDGIEGCARNDKAAAQAARCGIVTRDFPGLEKTLLKGCQSLGIELEPCVDGRPDSER